MRTREEIGLSDHRYRSLVEQVPAVSYVAGWEPGSPFTYVSPQIEQLLGFPAERWVAEPELWAERLHPDDRELVLMEEMRTFQHELEFAREYRMIAADGSVKWMWERDTIVRDVDGRPSHTEGVMVDITERKLAEAAPSTTSTWPARSWSSSAPPRPSSCSTATAASCWATRTGS